MNRFMVVLGFGSLIGCFLLAPVDAEMPTYVNASTISSQPESVVWHETLQSGWKEARRREVPMVIYITSENCQYCEAMKRDTWCDQSIRQRLSEGYVAIRLTPRNNADTISRIKLKMFPATLIGLPQGKIIDHKFGYQPPSEMHNVLLRNSSKAKRFAHH